MRREAWASAGRHAAKFLPRADDVNWRERRGDFETRRRGDRASRVGDGEGLAVNLVGTLIVGELVAQETQEGDDPGVAGHAGGEVSFGKVGQAVLENAPEGAGIGEGGGDFV